MSTTRREFIRFVVAGSVAAGCPVDLSLLAATSGPTQVDGDHYEICHQVRDGHRFAHPPATRKYDVVIVGGGVSGLTTAYLLRDKNFLLLEKESHWGGNSYEEDYNGAAYSTGGAFVDGEAAEELSAEIGLHQLPVDNWDGTIIQGKFTADTWGEGLDHLPYPQNVRDSFKKFRDSLLQIDVEKRATELYNTSFSKFTGGYAPEVKQWWDTYGPSNWGAQVDDTAAKVAIDDMQYMAGPNRKDIRTTLPGGLGAINKRLSELMQPHHDRMLLDATIVAVVPQKHEVNVTYLHDGKLQTVAAKGVIMATPKFITARIVEGMPEKQRNAIAQIHYVPYPVVNLVYDRPVFNVGYDTWCPGNSFTDITVADWVVRNQAGYKQKYNILTCYTPMRRELRSLLLTEAGCRQVAANVLSDFQKLLPNTNIDPVEVDIYRRGHPMFMAMPGNYTQVLPIARQPMERVFFANTDSEGPVSTTAGGIMAARRAVKEYDKMLGSLTG
jgi:monoamine oxidase